MRGVVGCLPLDFCMRRELGDSIVHWYALVVGNTKTDDACAGQATPEIGDLTAPAAASFGENPDQPILASVSE